MGQICSFDEKDTKSSSSTAEPTSSSVTNIQHHQDAVAAAAKKVQKKIEDLQEDDLSSDDEDADDAIVVQEMEEHEEEEEAEEEETQETEDSSSKKKIRRARVFVMKKVAPSEDAPKVKSTYFRTIKTSVHHVYDGDTVTLNLPDANKPGELTRVRLVGIDAPEVKQGEDFSQESKKLVKQLCDKKDVEVEVDTREEADKYGRMIGRIFVRKSNGKRINVNNKVISLGLGNVYFPGHSKAFGEIKEQMLALQKQALANRVGIWSDFVDDEVYKTRNGGSYHKKNCEHVSKYRLEKLNRSECLEKGMSGCRTCQP